LKNTEYSLKKISKNIFGQISILKNIFFAAMGNSLGALIGILLLPLITRLYSPSVIGDLGVFVSALTIAAPISTFMYQLAIPMAKSNQEAEKISFLALSISIFVSLSIALIICIWALFVGFLNFDEIEIYIYIFPIAVFLTGMHSVLMHWVIRMAKFYENAKVSIFQAAFVNLNKIVMGYFYPYSTGLILVHTFGIFSLCTHLYLIIKDSNIKVRFSEYFSKSILNKAREYKQIAIYRCPQEVLFNFSQAIPIILLSFLFGAGFAGQFLIARNILLLPSTLIGRAFGDVLFEKMSKSINSKVSIYELVIRPTLTLSIIGLIPLLIILIFGEALFPFVFGEQWSRAGEYSIFIAIFAYFNLMNKPSVSAINVLGLQKWLLKWEIANTLFKIIALIFAYYLFENDISLVISIMIAGSISYSYLIFRVIIFSKRYNPTSSPLGGN
tara:strand:- start:23755 stop:25080 length:1326 start_codon:yes stop_codon:yes gene_type:complete